MIVRLVCRNDHCPVVVAAREAVASSDVSLDIEPLRRQWLADFLDDGVPPLNTPGIERCPVCQEFGSQL